ncbi:FUSC family protein [Mycobacterium sp. DL592]|uniref:FUSC family protein n=1 Tax=Mycobacterium sp. DL592 TaxID=2675524 RepID=UPI00141E0A28|nr:FUSC family protein [Mycobacterium sp. DL592]
MSGRGGLRLPDGTGPALRGLVMLFASIWVALTWGPAHAVVPIGAAMAILGSALSDPWVPDRRRSGAVLLAVLVGIVLLAVPASTYPPLLIVLAVLICLATGLMWTLGGGAGLIGVGLVVVVLTAGTVESSVSATVVTAAMVLGCGAAHLLLVPRWRRPHERAAERAAATHYRAVADVARAVIAAPGHSPALPAACGGPADRIVATLHAIAVSGCGGCSECQTTLRAAVDVLTALGDERRQGAARAAEALRTLDSIRVVNPTAASWRLRGQLHEAVVARFGVDDPLARRQPRVVEVLRREIRWSSPVFRHAVRLAIGVGAALALTSVRTVPEGVWIPLIALVVLRPGCPRTYLRSLERIAGAAVGLTAATAITMLWHPIPPLVAALAVAFLAAGWAVQARGPWGMSTVVVGALAILLQAPAPTADLLGQRLFAAALGAAIAVWMYALLPDPAKAKLYRGITEMLRAHLDYAAAAITAFVCAEPADTADRETLRRRATAARRVFDTAAGSTRVTNAETAEMLHTARREATGLAIAIAVLDAEVPAARDRLAGVLGDASDEYVTALVGAGVPWRLDAAWLGCAGAGLRLEGAALAGDEQVAGLLTQVEAITRHALTLGEMAQRVTGHLSYAYAVGDDVH